MPPLLQSAQLKPDVIITSVDSHVDIDDEDERLLSDYGCLFGNNYL